MSGVTIRVRANSQQARSELKKVEQSVGNIEKATQSLATAIKGAIATYSGFVTVKGIVQAADSFKLLENRLKLVAKEGEPVSATMLRLNRLAIESRTGITTTATNYQRLARSFQGTNRTSGDFLKITEAINKATKIGGQPLATQQAALFQLSQAFASGVLRGEEFNSVSEGAPEILSALTQALGVSRAELREMAFDGQITSDILADSLLKQLPKIRDEFELLTPTVNELTEIMKGEFTRALSEIDKVFDFSGSTAGKIELLTTAFSYIADNAVIQISKAQIVFYKFAYDVAFVVEDVKKALLSLFQFDFDPEAFRERFSKAYEGIKNLDFFKSIPVINLENSIKNVSYVLNTLETWKNAVILVFKNMYDAIIGNSWWRKIFDEGEYAIGSGYYVQLLTGVLGEVKVWGRKFVDEFKNIFLGYEEVNPFNEKGRESRRSGGIASFFYTAIKAINDFSSAIKNAVTESDSFKESMNFFITKKSAFQETFKLFTDDIAANGGILGYLTKLSQRLSEVSNKFSNDLGKSIDKFIKGTPIPEFAQENGKEDRVGGLLGEGGFLREGGFADRNKWLAAGAAFAGAVVIALPNELRNSAIQGALFGLGYVIAAGFLSIITAPITLGIAAVAFLPQALSFLNDEGIFGVTTKDIGRAIGDGVINFFKDDAGQEGFGTRLINAIIDAAGEFGAGLAEGLDIDIGPMTEKLGGAFALAVAGATAVGILRNGVIGTGAWIVKTILTAIGARFTVGALGTKLSGTLIDIKDDKKILDKATASGIAIGSALIRGLFSGLLVVGIADSISSGVEGLLDESVGKVDKALLLGAIEGGGVGAAVGLLFGPFGAIGGAIVGGILGSIVAALTASVADIDAWVVDIGNAIYDGLISGWDRFKDNITSFFSNLNPFGESGTAAGEIGGTFSNNKVGGTASENSLLKRFINFLESSGYASGGYIRGPGGPKDDQIPAMLSNGEFVIQASAVSKFGTGFFAALNSGIKPLGFMGGTAQLSDWQKVQLEGLRADEQLFLEAIADAKRKFDYNKQTGSNTGISAAVRQRDAAQQGLDSVYARIASITGSGTITTADGSTISPPKKSDGESLGKKTATDFAQAFKDGLVQAISTGDFKDFGKLLLDKFTMSVIDAVVTGFTDALFKGLTAEGGGLTEFFNSLFKLGEGITEETGKKLEEGLKSAESESKGGVGFKGIIDFTKGIFGKDGFIGKIIGSIGTLFKNFDLSSVLGSIPFLPFNSGGIVPNTPYSRVGVDSVPAMLTPGELVVPANKVDRFMNNQGKSNTVVNLSITGDVSRQTRQEIVKMLPTIASGVNAQNKERNYKYR